MSVWANGGLVRAALRVSVALWWANYLLTARWSHIDGSLHGPKEPWFVAALVALTVAVWWPAQRADGHPGVSSRLAGVLAAAGVATLAAAFFVWFPPNTWTLVPFLDDWPPRYQSTREFIQWLDQGTLAGWQWNFLGGYHTSSDVTQSLGALAYLPMKLVGDAAGFHALHLALFAAIPLLIWRDLSLDASNASVNRAAVWLAVGASALLATNYSYFLLRSGDTNSLAGAVLTLSTLVGAHAARRGRRWGSPWLVSSLVLVAYSHAGSLVYAAIYLSLDAGLARDWRSAARAAVAVVTAVVVALPMTFESWRYPDFFQFNNIFYIVPASIDWPALVRKVGYNVELLWLPGRWFNDYAGLSLVLAPVSLALVWRDRSRARFFAAAALLTLGLMRLNVPDFGYAFLRPIHMLAIFMAPVVAVTIARYAWSRPVALALVATVALYTQIWWHQVPHVTSIRDFNAALVDRVTAADGALVLLENNPHRDTNAESEGRSEPSRFGIHFESLLAEATARRLYAGYWDGWQWSPWRGQMLAGGTWRGRAIGDVPIDTFVAELDRWGIVDLFVWSPPSVTYLNADPRFARVWDDGVWTQFHRREGDAREVATTRGTGTLADRSVLGATVVLSGVTQGDPVVVRTNHHPAWTALSDGRDVPLVERDGQVSFDAPCDGDCQVALVYPGRPWLWWLAAVAWGLGVWGASLTVQGRGFSRAAAGGAEGPPLF